MTFNTGKPVPSTDPRDLYDNAENLDKLVNGVSPFYPDRLGKLRESWAGMENSYTNAQEGRETAFKLSQTDKESRFQAFLLSSGYVSKGDYAAGVVLAERNEYVAVDAATTGTSPGLYRPNASATLPLTLTGAWVNDSANLVLLGDDALRQEIVSGALLTASMVSGVSRNITDVVALRATAGRFDGEPVNLLAYGTGFANGGGGGLLYWNAESTAPDDGGVTFAVEGVPTGRWVRRVERFVDAAWYGLPLATGFCLEQDAAIEAYCFANKVSAWYGPGVYDFGEENWSWSGVRAAGQPVKDYQGVTIYSCPQATFQTTSANGADVMQCCGIKNFAVRGYPKVKATLTAASPTHGSNGVSLVFGAENVTFELACEGLPAVYKTDGSVDGGQAFTIQPGANNTNPFRNVTLRGSAKNCSVGFGLDVELTDSVSLPIGAVDVDLYVEECYRAFVNGGAGYVTTPSLIALIGVNARVRSVNCQQGLVAIRPVGLNIDIEVMNTKPRANLIKHPHNTAVVVTTVHGGKSSRINVHGRVISCDTMLDIGGISMGGGVTADCRFIELTHRVTSSGSTNEVNVVNFSGATVTNSILDLHHVTSGYQPLVSAGNQVSINGQEAPHTFYPGDASIALPASPLSTAIYANALSSVRTVVFPSGALAGSKCRVVRLASATGGGVSVGGLTNISAGTWIEVTYSGSAWAITGQGAV